MNFFKSLKCEILRQLAAFEEERDKKSSTVSLSNNCKIYFRSRPVTNKCTDGDLFLQLPRFYEPKKGLQEVVDFLSNSESQPLLAIEEWRIVTSHQLAARLKRPHVFALVLEDVYNGGSRYGCPVYEKCVSIRGNLSSNVVDDSSDASTMRLHYVFEHISSLLTICCSSVCSISGESIPSDDASKLSAQLLSKARNSLYLYRNDESAAAKPEQSTQKLNSGTSSNTDLSQPLSFKSDSSIMLDLKKYLTANNLPCGCLEYDNTANSVLIVDSNNTLSKQFVEVLKLESSVKTVLDIVPDMCVHVTPINSVFSSQQVDLVWRIVGQYCPSQQWHCFVAPVLPAKPSSILSVSHLKRSDLEMASAHKYGSVVGSEDWRLMLEQIVDACIKYNLLATSIQRPVKLEIGNDSSLRCIKSGSFVLYNYARLSTLLDQFDKCVKEKTYPGLPSIQMINWSLLKKEDEWGLLLQYVAYFPVLIDEMVLSVINDVHVCGNFPIHRLYKFLLNMSHDISTYYSSVHILASPHQHLWPQMFARLHLLKAIHQVMTIIFEILDITPLRQM